MYLIILVRLMRTFYNDNYVLFFINMFSHESICYTSVYFSFNLSTMLMFLIWIHYLKVSRRKNNYLYLWIHNIVLVIVIRHLYRMYNILYYISSVNLKDKLLRVGLMN